MNKKLFMSFFAPLRLCARQKSDRDSATEVLQALISPPMVATTLTAPEISTIAIKPQFDQVHFFCDGLASVMIDNQWSYIDKNSNFVIKPQFNDAYKFAEGLAAIKKGRKYGYIDKSGNFVIQPQFDDAYWFTDGIARVKKGLKWGYIDTAGNFVIQPQFDQV
ncbi:MAG: WG repeat-containing protein [Moorea sp. SIO2B7]|nr:WG repeat-containing protein [Moorena sp. SIO2B7]